MFQITQTQALLLRMIAAVLFQRQLNIPADVDWNTLMQESKAQSVALQVYSAAEPYLPEEVKEQWQSLCATIGGNNVRVEWEHSQLHRLMDKAQIPYVVMKGCVSGAYYPDPQIRTLGDVDLLVDPADLDRAGKVLEQAGFIPHCDEEEDIHIAYTRGRAVWEMHWQPNGIPAGAAGEQIRQYLATAISDGVEYDLLTGSYRGVSAFHHGLIMLLHTATHLINTGIGLRHLCDWAVFAAAMPDEQFREIFEQKLKTVGLWRFAQLLTLLSVRYLGCPEKEWAGSCEQELLEKLMADIFAGGNFGSKDEQRINQAKLITNKGKGSVDDTSLARQLVNTMNEKARIGMPACEKHPVLLPVGWLYVGIRHLGRIIAGKRPKLQIDEMVSGASQRRDIYKQFRLFETE